jgi:hypothetical protein
VGEEAGGEAGRAERARAREAWRRALNVVALAICAQGKMEKLSARSLSLLCVAVAVSVSVSVWVGGFVCGGLWASAAQE